MDRLLEAFFNRHWFKVQLVVLSLELYLITVLVMARVWVVVALQVAVLGWFLWICGRPSKRDELTT